METCKNESCLKRGNESRGQYPKEIGVHQNSKNLSFTIIFFIFKYYFGIFQVF